MKRFKIRFINFDGVGMSTIKDVAKLAGVSLGTVSNVLNARNAVNPEKVRRVQEAIEKLNYKPHEAARSLKTSRTMNVGVVLPDIIDPVKSAIFTGVERVLSQHGYTVSLYTTSDIPAKENAVIERILNLRTDGLIISTCQPENSQVFEQLAESGTALTFIERAVKDGEYHLVEFDNYSSIFRTASEIIENGITDVLLITGPSQYSNEHQCIDAYRKACSEVSNANIKSAVLSINYNKENSFRHFTKYLQRNSLPGAVICTGTPLVHGVIKALDMQAVEQDSLPLLYSLSEENWAEVPVGDFFRIARRPITLGEKAAELLLEEIESNTAFDSKHLTIKNMPAEGNRGKMWHLENSENTSLKILMLNSPSFRALKSLIPDFRQKYGVELEFDSFEYSELSSIINDPELRKKYDVFQVDIPWLTELAQSGALLNLSGYIENIEPIAETFIPGVLSAYSEYEDGIYAMPFMFGTQLLYYRRDLFDDPSNKLMFREKYGFDLNIPRTWAEYNLISEFFTRSINPESPVLYGTTLGGKIYSGAVCEFLPRMWAYGGEILDKSGRAAHDRSAIVKALKIYTESYKYAHPDSADYWWDEQVHEFISGNAAMMILFIAHATDLADLTDSDIVGKIGYDIIPGGCPMLGGWSIAVNSDSGNKDEAINFIKWAVSKELAIPQTILGGSTASISLYKSSELLSIYPWLPKALESFKTSRKRDISKITTHGKLSEKDFEIILGEAIHKSVRGELSPEAAVEQAFTKIELKL